MEEGYGLPRVEAAIKRNWRATAALAKQRD
jgi:hypothetical protein